MAKIKLADNAFCVFENGCLVIINNDDEGVVLTDKGIENLLLEIAKLPKGIASADHLRELQDDSFKLSCLERGGVDNWEWYGDSLEEYWESKEEDE